MQKKGFLFLLLCLLLAISAQAQRMVRITILEKDTQQPLVGATVQYATSKEMLDVKNAITDIDGKVILSIEKGKELYYNVHATGFVPVKGSVPPQENNIKIVMREDVLHLNDVVVTGSRTERPVKLSPITTQVLGGKALVDAGYSDLQHALQQETPGLNIQKVGFGNEISLQGLDARHVLFLQDGERMTGDMAGNLDYERFNLHAIDRVEIVKGASSTLYGSRASGAVINLISKKATKPLDIQAGMRWAQMNERNYKTPSPKDFLYMFEKNSDRPNLQAWLSAGVKHNAFTSQTDVWYSESDAFYMYQADNDRKTYTKEANPFLPHDITLTSVAARSPMGIEGTEHISAAQKFYYEPNRNLSVQMYGSMFFHPHTILHIKVFLAHERCTEDGFQAVVRLVIYIVDACRGSVWRCGVHLYAVLLAYVYIAVCSIQGKPVEEVPFQDSLNAQHTLTAEVGVFKVILHIIDVPYSLNLLSEKVSIGVYVDEESVMTILGTQRKVMILLGLQVFASPNLKHP